MPREMLRSFPLAYGLLTCPVRKRARGGGGGGGGADGIIGRGWDEEYSPIFIFIEAKRAMGKRKIGRRCAEKSGVDEYVKIYERLGDVRKFCFAACIYILCWGYSCGLRPALRVATHPLRSKISHSSISLLNPPIFTHSHFLSSSPKSLIRHIPMQLPYSANTLMQTEIIYLQLSFFSPTLHIPGWYIPSCTPSLAHNEVVPQRLVSKFNLFSNAMCAYEKLESIQFAKPESE